MSKVGTGKPKNDEQVLVSKQFVRGDVTDEFPFLVTKLSPYYDRWAVGAKRTGSNEKNAWIYGSRVPEE